MTRFFANWRQHKNQNLLSYRLLIYILMCSTLLAILSTAVQLFWDYKNDVNNIEKGIQSIEAGYLDSLASSLWKLDQDQIGIQLDGIMKLPDIGFASITEIVADKEEAVFYRGDREGEFPIFRQFQLFYNETLVGNLEVGATLDNVYDRLLKKFLVILGSQAIKTFLVSICILTIVHLLVVRHLNSLSRFTQGLDLDNLDKQLKLDKPNKNPEQSDAIDQLATTLSSMQDNIRLQLSAKKKAQDQLQQLNDELEQRVRYRTATLKHTNERLETALQELTETKDKLVESEKMAALGELVSGVAHEINTPVGNSLTSASLISDITEDFQGKLADGTLTQHHAEDFSRDLSEASELINANLQRASALIANFKQIAVDQTKEQTSAFNIRQNLQDTLAMLNKEIKQCPCQVELNCDPEITVVSYPGGFTQVFDNLISNSLLHGFKDRDDGRIKIDIEQRQQNLHILYRDNGRGIPEQIRHRIFNPFVTSSRSGGSGLGTHLVYNLVTQLLQGTISCSSDGETGTEFKIQIPLNAESQPDDEADDLW